ncbi:PstS family phosphate ABC transporter substrate-binding protein [Streptomyces sp. NPDC002402]
MTAPPSVLRRTVTAVLGVNRSPAGIRRPAYPLGSRILAAILGVQLPERPSQASASQRPEPAGQRPQHSTEIVDVAPPGAASTAWQAPANQGRSRLAWVAGALATVLAGGLFSSVTLLGSSPADHFSAHSCAKGRLAVVGSTTLQSALEIAAADYERVCGDAEIRFDMRGSTEGLDSLQEEDNPGVRLAFTDGRNQGYEGRLNPHPIAVIPFNVVVSRTIDISGLTIQQLRDIYSGERDNWRLVGGPDLGVRIIGRGADSGTRAVFEEKILGRSEPALSSDNCTTPREPGAPVVRCERASTSEVLDAVNRVPGAIGYAPLEAANAGAYENVAPVRINGTEPAIETIESGDYPFWTVGYAYTRGEPPADSIAASFLAFLASPDGEVALDEYGYFPCTRVAEHICARS